MYMKDSFNNIRNKISKNKISIKEVCWSEWKNQKDFLKKLFFFRKCIIMLSNV